MIFPADQADVERIAALEAGLLGVDAWSGQQVAEELVAPGRRILVFTAGGNIAGYVITMTLGEVCDLQRIGVDPAWQRGGVGGELLGAAARFAVHDGAERMLLEVAEDNAAAIAFYGAAGFTEIDRRPRYYRNGAAALVLELGLRPDRAE